MNGRQLSRRCHVEFVKHIPRRNYEEAGHPTSYKIGMINAFYICHDHRGRPQVFGSISERQVLNACDDMYVLQKRFPDGQPPLLVHVDRFRRQIHLAPHFDDIKSSRKKRSANDHIVMAAEPNIEEGVFFNEEGESNVELVSTVDPNSKLVGIPMREIL